MNYALIVYLWGVLTNFMGIYYGPAGNASVTRITIQSLLWPIDPIIIGLYIILKK